MPEIVDHVAFLSQQVGPRPAGTEEEQQAALYITEQLQKEAGLSAAIEDFNSPSNADIPWAICCGITFVFVLLSLFVPLLAIPAIILTFVAVILLGLEILGKPVLTKLLSRGVSQNIVAKYEPHAAGATSTRRRKVVLVTRYDSGKTKPELSGGLVSIMPILQWVLAGGMVFLPILLLIRNVFFLHAVGAQAMVLNVLTIIGLVIVAIPLVLTIIHKVSSYNEAANSNASGVAVLLDVAYRVGKGIVKESQPHPGVRVHGEQAAYEEGLVPQGTQIRYEAKSNSGTGSFPASATSDDRLASAKAAVAALTGKPVAGAARSFDIADNLVQVKDAALGEPSEQDLQEQRSETREALSGAATSEEGVTAENHVAETASPQPVQQSESSTFSAGVSSGVPDWFKKGQEAAKKTDKEKPAEVQRSRFATALDAAENMQQQEEEKIARAKTEEQLKKVHEGFRENRITQPAEEIQFDVQAEPERVQPDVQAQETSVISLGDQEEPEVTSQRAVIQSFKEAVTFENAFESEKMPGTPDFIEPLQSADAGEADQNLAAEETRQPIVLPDIGITASNLKPSAETQKQRAPLAQVEESSEDAAKSLLTMLPSIDLNEEATSEEQSGESDQGEQGATSAHEKPNLTPYLRLAEP